MIYVTADLHGDLDRLRDLPVRLKRRDTLIVLGDFGFLWSGDSAEKKKLRWLGKRPYHLLFLDGAHENYDLLREYPVTDFLGGRAQQISGRLYHLLRGEIYTIEEKTLLCFGGGESEDKDSRTEGKSWWRRELPSADELDNCLAHIERCNRSVDFVLTHDAPSKLLLFLKLSETGLPDTNRLETFLDEIASMLTYTHWYFGCHHRDLTVS
ncbi:MAG: metallophosphoesterase, partial [Pygmaiobacter sp.]